MSPKNGQGNYWKPATSTLFNYFFYATIYNWIGDKGLLLN